MGIPLIPAPEVASRLGASIEIPAKQALDYLTIRDEVPSGTEIYLPDLGGDSRAVVLKAAGRLGAMGYRVVPHLAARRVESLGDTERWLRDLQSEAGVSRILVIAGDAKAGAGPFTSTMDVLETGLLGKYGFNDIRVAGHPEGSWDFDDSVAFDVLRAKSAFCKRAGATLKIVTQFGFDGEAVVGWCRKVRREGIDASIDVGVAGPARLSTLIKYAAVCGVGNSASFLRKRAGQISGLLKSETPEPLLSKVEGSLLNGTVDNVGKVHVFAFGGIRTTSKWLVERGSWNLG